MSITTGSNNSTLGQQTSANSTPVVIASDQGALPANINQIGGSSLTLGQAAAASSLPVVTQADSAPATQNITTQDLASTTAAGANSQNFITGTPTAGSAASFAFASFESAIVQVIGTWTGTLQVEISMDGGTTWFTRGVKQSGVSNVSSSFTANFQGACNFSGMTNFRVRATAAMTGTATVRAIASINPDSITVSNPVLLKDGTTQSILNTIKAASTSALATDTSIVTAFSPNSPLPAGSATIGAVTQASGPWTQNLTQFGGSAVVTGTGASGAGIPRVTVSNDSNVLATQSGTWNISNVSGTVSLPTNAAQETGGHLASLDAKFGSLGQKTMANSAPVVLASDQSSIPVAATQSGTWTVQQGNTPTAVANAWAVKLTDGTNTTAVKAASTAAAAADPSAVVALSPNSPLPTGSNVIGALTANQSINLTQIGGNAIVTGAVNGLLAVGGNAASGATDSGDPVKVGGIFNTTLPTITNGQRGDLQLDNRARPIISPLTNASVVKSQLQDNAGNGITSQSTGVTPLQPLDVDRVSVTINKYIAAINILQSANTASGTVFTMRNGASATKDVIVDRIFLDLSFNGGANASTPRYNLVRFSGATPTGGTAITVAKLDNSSPTSQVTDVRFLDTGLTTTGVTFESGNISTFSTSAANNNNDSVDLELPIRLAAGEGLAIQILATTRTGVSINGHILWSER